MLNGVYLSSPVGTCLPEIPFQIPGVRSGFTLGLAGIRANSSFSTPHLPPVCPETQS